MSYFIAVSGGTTSGKTSTCLLIQKQLETENGEDLSQHVLILSMDSFYLGIADGEHAEEINFDHPSSFDWDLMYQVLFFLKNGETVDVPIYNFVTHKRDGFITVKPEKCVIFEGILTLYDQRIRDLFDIKVFVETASDIRLIRRIKRDIAERGRTLESVLDQCEKTVIPAYDQFIEPTKKYADLIIPRGKTNLRAIAVLVSQIKVKIKSR